MPGRRGDMGYEEGELQLEEGEAALSGADGYGYGGGELVDMDATTYIVRDALRSLFRLFAFPFGGLDGWRTSWCCAVSSWFLRRADCCFARRTVANFVLSFSCCADCFQINFTV